ncbi:MAG: dephospho-CoA kinase [Magnetococcales bacterium]|nr:dephospho-CoA kinase [Magnetococcales bacterium]
MVTYQKPNKNSSGLFLIGITGTMGCGKSTVTKLFADRGAHFLDADKLAREVVQPGQDGWHEVVDYFGKDVLITEQDGKTIPFEQRPLNRKKLGELIFNNPTKRKVLENIIHPKIAIIKAGILKQWADELQEGEHKLVVMEVPLLFEAGLDKECDLTLAVVCGEQQWQRLSERKNMSAAIKKSAIAQQLPEAEKKNRADRVIDNGGTLADTAIQVEQLRAEIEQKFF